MANSKRKQCPGGGVLLLSVPGRAWYEGNEYDCICGRTFTLRRPFNGVQRWSQVPAHKKPLKEEAAT